MEQGLLWKPGMRRKWGTVILAGAAVLVARSGPVRAEQTAIGADVGFASAVGWAGITVTRQILDHARIEVGGGYGYTGWQLSLMPKLTVGGDRDRFVAGIGVSVSWPTEPRYASGHPVWLNVDLAGAEHRFASGLAVSGSFGLTAGLGGGQICLPPDGCETQFLESVTGKVGPQARVGAAYWF